MKKIHFYSILFWFLSSQLFAQTTQFPNLIGNNKVTAIAYWELGDSRNYHVTITEESFKNDKKKPFKTSSLEYDVHLSVVEMEDSSYVLELVYENFVFPDQGKNKEINEIENSFKELSEGLKIRYKTNELGEFDSIINLTELASQLDQQLTLLEETMVSKIEEENDKNSFEVFMKHYRSIILDPKNIEVLYAEEILKIHGYYGILMELSKPIDFVLEYPVFNSYLLNGKGTLTLNAINKDADQFVFSTNEQPDRAEMQSYLRTFFELLSAGLPESKLNFSEFSYSMKSKSKFTLELSSGWLIKVTRTSTSTTKLTKNNSTKTISKTVIERK